MKPQSQGRAVGAVEWDSDLPADSWWEMGSAGWELRSRDITGPDARGAYFAGPENGFLYWKDDKDDVWSLYNSRGQRVRTAVELFDETSSDAMGN